MKEQLITFETAKLAKEKGFDWYCKKCYDEQSISATSDTGDWEEPLPVGKHYAPTQSLLQKWLREEPCVSVFIIPSIKENHNEWFIIDNDENTIECEEAFGVYEDALEMGLQEALKLIKE